jgi:hypothetical protein
MNSVPAPDPNAALSIEEQQRQARERWLEGKRTELWDRSGGIATPRPSGRRSKRPRRIKAHDRDHGIEDDYGL